jgi:hypothetical protein
MNKIIRMLLTGALFLPVLFSCQKEETRKDPMEVYKFAYSLNTGGESTYTNKGEEFVFTGLFTDPATGNALTLSLVCDGETLASGNYTPSSADYAGSGNYIIGNKTAPSTFTFGQYGRTYNIIAGDVAVTASGGNCSLQGVLALSNGLYVDVTFSGTVSFTFVETKEDTGYEYTELNQVLSASAGEGVVTLQLGSSGITVEQSMWGAMIGGSGCYVSIDLYSANGSLSPGTYTIGPADGTTGPGQFAYGKVEEVSFMGMTFTVNTGSSFHSLIEGEDTTECITSGEVIVEESGGSYIVKMHAINGTLFLKYEGPITL